MGVFLIRFSLTKKEQNLSVLLFEVVLRFIFNGRVHALFRGHFLFRDRDGVFLLP